MSASTTPGCRIFTATLFSFTNSGVHQVLRLRPIPAAPSRHSSSIPIAAREISPLIIGSTPAPTERVRRAQTASPVRCSSGDQSSWRCICVPRFRLASGFSSSHSKISSNLLSLSHPPRRRTNALKILFVSFHEVFRCSAPGGVRIRDTWLETRRNASTPIAPI